MLGKLSGLEALQVNGSELVNLKRVPLGTATSALMAALYFLSEATMVGAVGPDGNWRHFCACHATPDLTFSLDPWTVHLMMMSH